MTGRLGRAALWTLAAAALGYLSLVGATNAVLRSDWLPGQINSDPTALYVTYTGARSVAPGRLLFDTLVLRSRDSNVEWEARLEDVSVSVHLLDLVSRRFRAGPVRAEALSFRLRERMERSQATPARLARYPRIAGFGDPPLRDPPAPRPPPGDPWIVDVDSLRVEAVREIWIDSWRWTGTARLSGGLFLRSGIEAEVFPSELTVGRGTLHWGGEIASRETAGTVRAAFPRFATDSFRGNDVWRIVSGMAALRGTLDGLGFLAPDGGGPRLAPGGTGTIRVRAELAGGRGSSRIDASAAPVLVALGERTLRGAFHAEVVAPRIVLPGRSASFDGTRLWLREVSLEGAGGAPWGATVEARRARLLLTHSALDADLSARLGDGRPLLALVPRGPPRWLAGLLDLRDFEASGRLRLAPGSLAITHVRAEAGTFSVEADWRRARGRYWGALLFRKGILGVGVGLGSGEPSLHLANSAGWFEEEGRPGGLRTGRPHR